MPVLSSRRRPSSNSALRGTARHYATLPRRLTVSIGLRSGDAGVGCVSASRTRKPCEGSTPPYRRALCGSFAGVAMCTITESPSLLSRAVASRCLRTPIAALAQLHMLSEDVPRDASGIHHRTER
ncbi:hypothetical protein NUW54_g12729 [Trametes sanguinea]|uniref:Uncharacterized protein n=1 Tax=Trametes sanguinea TaxID=158606 RepID=A0ACC1MVP6_9APHY|nr:hypothetical protein NUW54_g12729 [Trametes sanguinea]